LWINNLVIETHHHKMVSYSNQNSADSRPSEASINAESRFQLSQCLEISSVTDGQSLVSKMFYAARWRQSLESRVMRCVTSREGSWSACATFSSALARPLVGQHAVGNVPPGQEIASGIENRTKVLKNSERTFHPFSKRNTPSRIKKEKLWIFVRDLSKHFSKTL